MLNLWARKQQGKPTERRRGVPRCIQSASERVDAGTAAGA